MSWPLSCGRAGIGRWVFIPKPGANEQRPLSIPAVRDRIVQARVRAGELHHLSLRLDRLDGRGYSSRYRPGIEIEAEMYRSFEPNAPLHHQRPATITISVPKRFLGDGGLDVVRDLVRTAATALAGCALGKPGRRRPPGCDRRAGPAGTAPRRRPHHPDRAVGDPSRSGGGRKRRPRPTPSSKLDKILSSRSCYGSTDPDP
jgi:hypothetical protein